MVSGEQSANTEPMRMILSGYIAAFPPQQHFVRVTTIRVFDVFVSLHLAFGGTHPSTHERHKMVCTQEESYLHHVEVSSSRNSFDVSLTDRAACHEHADMLAAPWLTCWWACHILVSLWTLLVSCFTMGLCRRQLTKWWEHHHHPRWLTCIGQCVCTEQVWVLCTFKEGSTAFP